MTIQEIVDRVRRLCYTSANQYPDAIAVEDANIVYKDLTNTVTQEVNENYFFDEIKTDTTIDQSEYTLDDSVNWVYVNKLLDVFILPSNSDVYKKLQQYTKDDILAQWEGADGYYVADRSIFISPTPTEEISDWVKMDAILKPLALDIDSDEADINLDPEFHNLLAQWMMSYIYQSRGLLNEAANAKWNYEMAKSEMVAQLSDRTATPTVGLLPDLSFYE